MKMHSYPKVWNMGHRAIVDLFVGDVVVQEKVDGSQFSFGSVGGELCMRSKRAEVFEGSGMFSGATETARRLFNAGLLVDGWTYRGEVLQKPKHNAIAYDRVPEGNVILFDIDTQLEGRMPPDELAKHAEFLGLEAVPCIVAGDVIVDTESLQAYLGHESILGGSKVEGVVIKNYARWGDDGKMLMGKVVREDFRELNKKAHAKPGRGDIIAGVIETITTEARYAKAAQRLRDEGSLDQSPRDIGQLMKEVQQDVEAEAVDEIKEALWSHFRKDILRGASRGLPAWYKNELLKLQFNDEGDGVE